MCICTLIQVITYVLPRSLSPEQPVAGAAKPLPEPPPPPPAPPPHKGPVHPRETCNSPPRLRKYRGRRVVSGSGDSAYSYTKVDGPTHIL
jgi:hypothetical protein